MLESLRLGLEGDLVAVATSHGLLKGRLLSSLDVDERFPALAEGYLRDAVANFAQYPAVSLAWAAYLGMAVANEWDRDWPAHSKEPYGHYLGSRGFDDMDEHVTYDVLGIQRDSQEESRLRDVMLSLSEAALAHVRGCRAEPGTPEAFRVFSVAVQVMYRVGAALELQSLGYSLQEL